MKGLFKTFLENYYSVPQEYVTILLIGCEISFSLLTSAVVAGMLPNGFLGIEDMAAFSDAIGSIGVKTMVAAAISSLAVGIVAKIKPKEQR